MTTATQPTPETDDQYYKRVLHRVIDAEVAIIGKVETDTTTTRAEAKPDHKANLQAAEAYGHVSRGIRRSILLAKKLAQPDAPAKPAAPARPRNHDDARERVRAGIKHAIKLGVPDFKEAMRLRGDVQDRLEQLDLDDDLDDLPIGEIVAKLCRQMGIPIPPRDSEPAPEPDPYAQLTDEELAAEMRAEPTRPHAISRGTNMLATTKTESVQTPATPDEPKAPRTRGSALIWKLATGN